MMAAGFTSGAFLLAVLIGASYSYPVKTGGDQSSSGGGVGANPGYGSSYGFGYQAPHGAGPFASVSGSSSRSASHPVAAAPSPYYAASVPVQHTGGFVPGVVPPVGQSVAPQAYSWEVDPVRPLPVETSSSSSSSSGAAGSAGAAGAAGAAGGSGSADSSASSSAFFPALPTYQGGELSHVEKTFEHGNSDSETEDQGSPRRGPGVPVPFPGAPSLPDGSAAAASLSIPYPPPGFGFPWYPYYDYQFLTGQYPPGTVSHFSTSFEQGRDQYHDNHYVRDLPVYYGHPQVPGYPPVQQQRH